MSYVGLLEVSKSGEVKPFAEVRNAMAWSPVIWRYFAGLYLPDGAKLVGGSLGIFSLMFDDSENGPLWRLWRMFNTGKLPELDNLLLGCTFDRTWVARERLELFAQACTSFDYRFGLKPLEEQPPPPVTWRDIRRHDDTVLRMAHEVRRLLKERPDAIGAALDGTSVNPSWWRIPVGEYDCRPLNVLTDKVSFDGQEIGEVMSWRE